MSRYRRIEDRVYAVIHQTEAELSVRSLVEGDDFLDGVATGQRAERKAMLERLHWILDPETWTEDIRGAEELVRRLNEDR